MTNEERLIRMEILLEQLIQMVGHNNAVTEELRQCMDSLETKTDKIISTQTIQNESIKILALRQLAAESEIEALKKAK